MLENLTLLFIELKKKINDLEVISTILYSEFVVQFLIISFILYVAWVGAYILVDMKVKTFIKIR